MQKFKDIKTLVNECGVINVRFIIPMERIQRILGIGYTSIGDPTDQVICKIDESRYKAADGYKIGLVPEKDEDVEIYNKKAYYQTDLESLMELDDFNAYILVDEDSKMEKVLVGWRNI